MIAYQPGSAWSQDDLGANVKFSNIQVCREISKVSLDTQSIPANSCTFNTGSRTLLGKMILEPMLSSLIFRYAEKSQKSV